MKKIGLLITFLSLCIYAKEASYCLTSSEGLKNVCARVPSKDSNCYNSELAFDLNSCLGENSLLLNTKYKIFENCSGFYCPGEMEIVSKLPLFPVEILKKYDTKKIAKSLVARHHKQKEIQNIRLDQSYSLYSDTKIVMEVPLGILRKITRNGFLNTHQTNTSSAFNDRQWRKRREQLFFRLKLPSGKKILDKVDELLPKYAYVIPSSDAQSEFGKSPMRGYSDTLIVFKDEVKKRSTLTNGDSLFGMGSASLLDVSDSGYIMQPLTFYSTKVSTKHYDNAFIEMKESYIEAQIWGELKMDDVDYVILGCYDKLSKKQIRKALRSIPDNISVYNCAKDWSVSHNQYKKGEALRRL